MDIKVIASGSNGNCYHVSDGKTSMLLDAGIPIKRIQVGCGFKLGELSGALISHRHNDHSRAVNDLVKLGVDVYAPFDVLESKGIAGHHRAHELEPLKTIIIGTFTAMPFECKHDVTNYGYLITSTVTNEKLLFFTDSYYIEYRFDGLNIIMAECNYSDEAIMDSVEKGCIPAKLVPRIVRSHMSLEHFLSMLAANDISTLKQVYLLHLSRHNSRADEFKEAVQRATGCEVHVC